MKKMKMKSPETDRDRDLEEMKARHAQYKAKKDGTEGEASAIWFKPVAGSNLVRFLPLREGSRAFSKAAWIHFGVGPENKIVRCITEQFTTRGDPDASTSCPVCRKFLTEKLRSNTNYERGSEEGKKAYFAAKDKYAPKKRFFANVKTKTGVFVFTYGPQIDDDLTKIFFGDPEMEMPGVDFASIEEGCTINVRRKGEKRQTKYVCTVVPESTKPLEKWLRIKKKMHDLEAAMGEKLSPAQIKQLMQGIQPDPDDEEQDADDRDEDRDEDMEDDED